MANPTAETPFDFAQGKQRALRADGAETRERRAGQPLRRMAMVP